MAKQFERIEPLHREFIARQRIFFNASAVGEGHVNVSPRDNAALRVLTANTVVYLDRTGSGNETAAHLLANGRLTLMFCAFEGPPLILRLYGQGRIVSRHSTEYAHLLASEFDGVEPLGARQMMYLDVDLVQTSCGFGVPLFDYVGERDQLTRWAAAKGEKGLEEYWHLKNERSIDGLPTGLFEGAGVS
jgi:pyridoxamine 5'-phosphate oxidase-like protein